MNIEDIRKNYRNFEDSKIEELANSQITKLRPEVIPLLIEEIRRRNLSENLIKGIDAQLKVLNPDELIEYCLLIQNQSCPVCNSNTQKLNGILLTEVVSYIFLTRTTKHLKIACSDCLQKFRNNSNSKTALLGWWGFPWGIIKTIQGLIQNSKMSRNITLIEPSIILKTYVLENIGIIEPNRNDNIKLKQMLERANRVS